MKPSEPKWGSLRKHPLPGWFDDAKLGIFVHWGLYSVPAYAPPGARFYADAIAEEGFEYHFKNKSYAEWYQNTLRIPGSPTRNYHERTFGRDFPYEKFADQFNEAARSWDPASWARTFKRVHARYVVLVTKHHDGFLLWHSDAPNPKIQGYEAGRDVAGEARAAFKREGLRFGAYYSGALDWSFTPQPITDLASMACNGPASAEYREYVAAWTPTIRAP
ncbi:MAG: hypothetical protein Kow0069_28930 [Promethearchaeota archaeon]